ncbi:Protein MAIN-LIKE 1 [Glycine soja]
MNFNLLIMVKTRGLHRTLGKVIGRALRSKKRHKLKLSSHGRKVKKFGRYVPENEGTMVVTGLSLLIACSLDTGDMELIFTFAKRWHKKTNSFYLLVGEVAITLDNVASLLHLPITDVFHSFETLHVDQVMDLLVDLLKVSSQEARDETLQCHETYSVTYVHVLFLDAFRDLSQTGSYAWEATAPVHMYENLNDASKRSVRQLAGYITLLQCWIYEYFPTVASSIVVEDYHERKPCACHWKSWKGLFFIASFIASNVICVAPRPCALDYIEWFYMISHPFMSPTQPRNHPRHPPVSVTAIAMLEPTVPTPTDVDMPRHALKVCQAITERLERLINLRIVTKGTEAYIVTEECLRISRSVTTQGNVYVR